MTLTNPYPNSLAPYVFQGVWKRDDEPPHTSFKWTLENFSALLVMGCLTSLLALTQTQCWRLIRFVIAQYKKSIRLPDDSAPDPLLQLSQGKAISSAMAVLSERLSRLSKSFSSLSRRRICIEREVAIQHQPVESSIFGIASIVILMIFLFIGVAIPWWLTEGALGSPIVRSKMAEDCLESNRLSHLLDPVYRETRADDIFRLCRDKLNAGCENQYYLSNPQITKERLTTCPFGGNICLNSTPAFEITHWNMSAFEMGVNSRAKLLLNHRLTCAPISLDPFLWTLKDNQRSIIFIPEELPTGIIQLNVSLVLSTVNGPNKFSNESSGLRMAKANGPFDLTVLPHYDAGIDYYGTGETFKINALLHRNDSQSFLVIHRAGPVKYPDMVDDPLFSAHNVIFPYSGDSTFPNYSPDYEATALGCFEQFQYCFAPSSPSTHCTDWGARNTQYNALADYLFDQYIDEINEDVMSFLENSNDQRVLSTNEMLSLFRLVPARIAVYDYLTWRIEQHKIVPLKRRNSLEIESGLLDSFTEQWILEVETWLMKAFLSGLLTVQDGALYALWDLNPNFSPEYLRQWKLCGRILFRNQDFTNIDWIGFWITIGCATSIILAGNQIENIHKALKYCSKTLPKLMKRIISFWTKFVPWILCTRRSDTRAGRFLNINLIFRSVNSFRPWYGVGSRRNPASSTTEMNDLDLPITTSGEADSGSTEEFWDVDNPV